MSIRPYFENIADAIREKNTDITTVSPEQMPDAIRAISGEGGLDTMTRAAWDALSTEEKRAYNLIGVIDSESRYLCGNIYNGKNYGFSWEFIQKIVVQGMARSVQSTYVQLGDLRFSDGESYLPSQVHNIVSSNTAFGSWVTGSTQGDTHFIFDNTVSTKSISSGGGSFEWTTIFRTPIDFNNYNILELWTANDSLDRDPYTNVIITFYDENNFSAILTIGDTNFPSSRQVLGYTNNNFKNEAVINQ